MSMDKLSSRFERILKITKIYNFIFFCQESNLSVGQREMCLLARERSVCWQERDLSVGKTERKREKERARPGRVPAKCEHSQK